MSSLGKGFFGIVAVTAFVSSVFLLLSLSRHPNDQSLDQTQARQFKMMRVAKKRMQFEIADEVLQFFHGIVAVTAFVSSVFLLLSLSRHPNDQSLDQTQARQFKMMRVAKKRMQFEIADEVLQFFHVEDAVQITWLHAVNSVKKLQEGLSGTAMMLEADVILRHNSDDEVPIMGHPPDVDSDLTLAEFLKATIGSKKGIKLDFKSTAVVEPSLKILQATVSEKKALNPIWLNADILHGPCDVSCDAVDPHTFLALCTKYFPKATLSLGWRTNKHPSVSNDYYKWSFVQPMKELLSNITQQVTFPVRANLVGKSLAQILWLLTLSPNYTLTVWSATFDEPNIDDLITLHNAVSSKRSIFYDLPSDQRLKLLDKLKT